MLIDHAKIYVAGGKGGSGCQSLYRDIFNRRGVPDGGDGGRGGDVIITSDNNLSTLLDYKYRQHHNGKNGTHGSSNRKNGRKGKDCIVRVPAGTIIIDEVTGLVIRDLFRPGENVIVARGGAAGIGSAKRSEATKGASGENRILLLELKLVADAGIIGFPNAGKSTLISRISRSHSKIAPYPFTTKSPKLGVVCFDTDSFVVADMPGIIEGAHEGKGLGDRFLRHIERTSVLVHLVDMLPLDGSDPVDNFNKLEKELELYGHNVSGKPRVIAANKIDMPDSEENLERFKKEVSGDVFMISALTGQGLDPLVKELYRQVTDVKKEIEEDNSQDWDAGSYGQAKSD